MHARQLSLAAVTAHPNPKGLPGSNVLQQLVNGAEAWALAIALLGAFIGAALWALASHTPQPPLRGARADGGADLRRLGADRRRRPRTRELLRAPRHDGQVMARRATKTTRRRGAAAPRRARPRRGATARRRSIRSSRCARVGGLVSGVVGKACSAVQHGGQAAERRQEAARRTRRRARSRRSLGSGGSRRVDRLDRARARGDRQPGCSAGPSTRCTRPRACSATRPARSSEHLVLVDVLADRRDRGAC